MSCFVLATSPSVHYSTEPCDYINLNQSPEILVQTAVRMLPQGFRHTYTLEIFIRPHYALFLRYGMHRCLKMEKHICNLVMDTFTHETGWRRSCPIILCSTYMSTHVDRTRPDSASQRQLFSVVLLSPQAVCAHFSFL